jgi:hypothetical protein
VIPECEEEEEVNSARVTKLYLFYWKLKNFLLLILTLSSVSSPLLSHSLSGVRSSVKHKINVVLAILEMPGHM